MAKRRSRWLMTLLVPALIAAALAAAFWPRPVLVDLGAVTRGPMLVTIDEEGRTKVNEPYVVSTPVAGRLKRVTVVPGDPVVKSKTVVAHMLPINPAALDIRTREQARAVVTAAEAALRVARADLNAAIASRELAAAELSRTQKLAVNDLTSNAALDRSKQAFRVASAGVDTAEAAISMREADLANARAQLIGFDDDSGLINAIGINDGDDIPLYSPADGRILRVLQQSETTLPAGAPIMEIGNVEHGLEVVVELVSSDAVRVRPGFRAIISDWGGTADLAGQVVRIDPFAITKYSALGVEEQRVPVTIAFTGDPADRQSLGHGYRVTARIVVWESGDAVRVPASALFETTDGAAVFVSDAGRAALRSVKVGQNNGITAEVAGGLAPGETVVLYPSPAVGDGVRIAERLAQ